MLWETLYFSINLGKREENKDMRSSAKKLRQILFFTGNQMAEKDGCKDQWENVKLQLVIKEKGQVQD